MSMRTETLSLVISGDGKLLGAELGRSERKVKTFSGKVGGMFAGVGKRITGAFGKLANPLALIGGTAGVMMAARDLMQYQDSISTLGISAGLSTEDMMKLDASIQSTAYTTGQSREALVSAVREMANVTGDTAFAEAAMESVGRASTAMSADVMGTAQAFGAFRRDMGASAEEAAKLYNIMAAMGTHNMSMDRFARSVRVLGLTKDNFAEYNALIKTIAPTFGGVEGAANAIDQIIGRINEKPRAYQRKIGRDMFDSDGAIKDYRAFAQRLGRLGARDLTRMFGRNFSKAFLPFQDDAGLKVFDDVIRSGERATHVTDAFARKQGEAKYQLNMLAAAGKEFAGAALSPIIANLTQELNALTSNPEKMAEFRNNLTATAEALGHIAAGVTFVAKGVGAAGTAAEVLGGGLTRAGQVSNIKDGKVKAALSKKYFSGVKGRYGPQYQNALLDEYSSRFAGVSADVREQHLQELIANNRSEGRGWGRQEANTPAAEVKNNNIINLSVGIAGDRVIAQSDDPDTNISATLNRGTFK
ncbi:MAG: hypothetical protein FWC23_05395 [Chitinispirillia bacterium]|nr:hypothetical protein [Chitinispirillia bacterium]MCL2268604.1 hypothetical protein [Chitinispirillia bacterium]